MGSTEQRSLQSILQAIIDQGNLTVTEVNTSVATGTNSLEVVKNLKLQELVGATATHVITLEAKAQELIQLINEQGLRVRINQAGHGFTFNAVQFDKALNKYVQATVDTSADAMAIRVNDNFFDLVANGSYDLPEGVVDSAGNVLEVDEYYFLDPVQAGGFTPIKPTKIYQPLFLVAMYKDKKVVYIDVDTAIDLEPRILTDEIDALGLATTDQVVLAEPTIADLIASKKYKVGDVVHVLGYYTKGDGAGHPRIKKPEGYTGADAVIGADGSIWGIVHNGEVNVSWFGANEFNSNSVVQNILNMSDNFNTIIFDRNLTIQNKLSLRLNIKYLVLDFNNVDVVVDIRDTKTIYGELDSLDYAFEITGDNEFIHIKNLNVSYSNNIPQWSGIHRTFACEEGLTKKLLVENVNVKGGIAPKVCQGSVFFQNKCVENFEFKNITYDCSVLPNGFEFGYRVLVNSEAKLITKFPQIVKYNNIKILNSTNDSGNGLIRCASSLNVEMSNIYSDKSDKVVWIRNYDLGIGENIDEYIPNVEIHNCTFKDFSTWAIVVDSITSRDFKKVNTNIINNSFVLTEQNTSQAIRLLPVHNVTISNNKFIGINEGVYFRNYSSTENMPRGTDKSFKNINIINNHFIDCFTSINNNGFGESENYKINGNVIDNKKDTNGFHMYLVGLNNLSVFGNDIKNELTFNRCISIGSGANMSRNVNINCNRISGNYSSKPFIYTSSSDVFLGNNYIYDNYIDNLTYNNTKELFDFPIARPVKKYNKEWIINSKPTSVLPSFTVGDLFLFENVRSITGYIYNGTTLLDYIPITTSLSDLDTPYHATQMSKLGILDSYHNYLTELHEYEKSQNVQSDSEIMNLNVLQPPIIPKKVEEYAKEYNLI